MIRVIGKIRTYTFKDKRGKYIMYAHSARIFLEYYTADYVM